jgi:tetratricopeptide (TPR) repeat protein
MVVYAILRETALKFGVTTTDPLPFGERFLKGAQAFATYIRLMFVPVGLHMERGIEEVSPLAVTFSIACLAGACIFVWKRWRERPAITFALLWFLVAWLPISGIYPLNAAIAEHWLYLPSIGFIAFVVGSLEHVFTSERIRLAPRQLRTLSEGCLAIILLCFTALTVRRNTDWHDNISLFTSTLEYAPNSSRVHYNLAVAYQGQGEEEKALNEFRETLRLDPGNAYLRLDLAAMRARKGEQEEAARLYLEAIRLNPNDPDMVEAYVNLARIYHKRGKPEEAAKLMQKAYQVNPEVMRKWFPQLGKQ